MGAGQTLAKELDGKVCKEAIKIELLQENDNYTLASKESRALSKLVINATDNAITLLDADGKSLTQIVSAEKIDNPTRREIKITGTITPKECFYGTGERFNNINQRGKKVDIWAVDKWGQTEGNSYVPIPLMISSKGYSVFMNRFETSSIDIGKTNESKWDITLYDGPVDMYLFAGTPAEALDNYTDLTGKSPMPADWTFGIYSCRHVRYGDYSTVEGIRDMVSGMQAKDLPWTSIIIEGWDAYDPATHKDLKLITDELHAKGKKVLIYHATGRIWHWLSKHDRQFYSKAMDAKPEYFVQHANGETKLWEAETHNPLDSPQRNQSEFVDMTKPEAWQWWIDTVSAPLHKEIGIDGAKIDFCEQFPEYDDLKFYDGSSPKGMHHEYPVLFNARMYEYYNKTRPEGGVCFSRGGGIGAQRYPMMWAGDQAREWFYLDAILKGSLSAGLSGIPFMCHDLAAYTPARKGKEAANIEKDVFVRGAQMACFGPNMQTHGTVTKPYDFDDEAVDIYRLYCDIHYALVPYLVDSAKDACKSGLPLMRHLILEFPEDENVFNIEDEYMLGENFLVAPVLDKTFSRDVYLPEGNWTELFSGKKVEGGKLLKDVPASRDTILVYVRNTEEPTIKKAISEIRGLFND